MGDAGFACVILAKFQSRAAAMVAAVDRAAAAADPAAAAASAHALKGAAANLSAEDVRAAAGAIEAAGHAGDAAALLDLLGALRGAMDRCLAYLPILSAELRQAAAA